MALHMAQINRSTPTERAEPRGGHARIEWHVLFSRGRAATAPGEKKFQIHHEQNGYTSAFQTHFSGTVRTLTGMGIVPFLNCD
jgi:hypothetical protein